MLNVPPSSFLKLEPACASHSHICLLPFQCRIKGEVIRENSYYLKISFLHFRNVPFLGFPEKTNKDQMHICPSGSSVFEDPQRRIRTFGGMKWMVKQREEPFINLCLKIIILTSNCW